MTCAAVSTSYHGRIYGQFIVASVPQIELADQLWLANQMAKIYRRGWIHQTNFRLCAEVKGRSYTFREINGKGRTYDTELVNPQTGNRFLYGFHYKALKGKGHD